MKIKKLDILSVCWQVIVNPYASSGKRQKLRNSIFALLKEYHLNFRENMPNTIVEANQTLKSLYADGFRHFIFLGGDGTANVIINGLFSSGIEIDDIYLVPIPVGTGNDWIRTHNYPSDYHENVNVCICHLSVQSDKNIVQLSKSAHYGSLGRSNHQRTAFHHSSRHLQIQRKRDKASPDGRPLR
jgi:diacylglycerol kinase family enzyme